MDADACTNEHHDPLYAYGYPDSRVTFADGHEHRFANTDYHGAVRYVYPYRRLHRDEHAIDGLHDELRHP